MLAHIVKIGNSQGIRLPKPILEQTGLTNVVDLRVEGRSIVLSPADPHPRAGWAEEAQLMHQRGDDALMDPSRATVFDKTEWEW